MSKRSVRDAGLESSLSEPAWHKRSRQNLQPGQSTGSIGPSWSTGALTDDAYAARTASSPMPAMSSPSAPHGSLMSAVSNQYHLGYQSPQPRLPPQYSSSSCWPQPTIPSPATVSRPVYAVHDEEMDVASAEAEGEGEALHRSTSAPELRLLLDPATAAAYNPALQVLQPQSSSALPAVSSTSGALVPYRHAQGMLF